MNDLTRGNRGRVGRRRVALGILLLAAGVSPSPIVAHDGPPFPLVVDAPAPGYKVSVWADPDVGTGTFYVMADPLPGPASPVPADRLQVEVWVEPVGGRLPRATYVARRQTELDRIQWLAEPAFDRQEQWLTGVRMTVPGEAPLEWKTEVEATPPGSAPGYLMLYLAPFVIFGALWGRALRARWSGQGPGPDPQAAYRPVPDGRSSV